MTATWLRSLTTVLAAIVVMAATAVLAPPTEARRGGNGGDEHCQGGEEVVVSYGLATDIRLVETVQLDGLGTACRHQRIRVQLHDDAGNTLVSVVHDGPHPKGTVVIPLDPTVPAADVGHVSINIGGAKPT